MCRVSQWVSEDIIVPPAHSLDPLTNTNVMDVETQLFGLSGSDIGTDERPAVQSKYPRFERLISREGERRRWWWRKDRRAWRNCNKHWEKKHCEQEWEINRQAKRGAEEKRQEEQGRKRQFKKRRNWTGILKARERGERGESAEKVTCWNRKERKQPPFSPIHLGSMLHKDFFVVVLLDKGLLPWERLRWHHLNWLSLCPADTKASSHPGGVRPSGKRGVRCVYVYLCVSFHVCVRLWELNLPFYAVWPTHNIANIVAKGERHNTMWATYANLLCMMTGWEKLFCGLLDVQLLSKPYFTCLLENVLYERYDIY